MEFADIIKSVRENTNDDEVVIGVEVPEHFQWSMLDLFKESLPECLIIPLYRADHNISRLLI